MLANQWFDRCWFSHCSGNTFLAYLIDWDFIGEYINLQSTIQALESESAEISDADPEILNDIQQDINHMQEELLELYAEYASTTKSPEPYDVAFSSIDTWIQNLNLLLDTN